MTQSQNLEEQHLPKVIPQRPKQPIKIDCDCSRGRGNFDQDCINDYDNLPKNYEKKPSFNRNHQNKEHHLLPKSNSMDINNQSKFRYTPGASDEPSQPEQSPQQDIIPPVSPTSPTSPTPQLPKPSSPKRESSFQKTTNKQPNQNNVSFGGKQVDDHKSNSNRKRGQNQDRGGSNYNRSNDSFNNRSGGGRNRSKGITHSTSFTLGTKRQQDQPGKASQPHPQVPLPQQRITTSQSNSSLQSPPTVTDWKPNFK